MTKSLIEQHIAWLRGDASPNTVHGRERCLRWFDHELPYGVEQSTGEEINAIFDAHNWARRTRSSYFGHLWCFYEWAIDPRRDGLDVNPMRLLRRPHVTIPVPRPATDDQLALALTAPRPWRTCVILAALAGLRCIEISRLRREDITADRLIVRGKGDKVRYVDTHLDLWAEIEPLPHGLIVRRTNGRRADAHYISAMCNYWLKYHLGANVTMHQLRHWFGTTLLERTGDLRLVQESMGHASVQSTQIYTAVSSTRRRAAVLGLALPDLARDTQPRGIAGHHLTGEGGVSSVAA